VDSPWVGRELKVEGSTSHALPHGRSANGASEHDEADGKEARATRSHTTETYIAVTDITVSPSTEAIRSMAPKPQEVRLTGERLWRLLDEHRRGLCHQQVASHVFRSLQ